MNERDREIQVAGAERLSSAPVEVVGGQEPHAPAPWQALHRRLRGRYPLAVVLALAGALGGAWVGWKAAAPEYRALGMIHVAPAMPSLQDPAGLNALPLFEGYMNYQVGILLQPRMAELALRTEAWRKTGQGAGPEVLEGFEENREVLYKRGSQHIQVAFTSPRPDVAIAGVHAVLDAYEELAKEQNLADERLEFARAEAERLTSEIKRVDDGIFEFTAENIGLDGLVSDIEDASRRILAAESDRDRIEQAIREREATGEPAEPRGPLSPQEIALEDPTLAQYLLDLAVLQAQEEALAERLGDKNPDIVAVRQRITVLQKRIEERVEAWNRRWVVTRPEGASLEDLQAARSEALARIQTLREESRKLRQVKLDVENLQSKQEDLKRRLSLAEGLKEQLAAQVVGKGRISIADRGTPPSTPSKDRRKLYGVMGGGLGGALGLLIVLLIGTLDRRLRSAVDVGDAMSRVKLLGLLPAIPEDYGDPESARIAGHCVHQVRSMLQILHARQPGACVCISGPDVASGKTTLTTALGLSFGHSGTRTLLVDADLSGRGLTRRVAQLLRGHVQHLAASDDATTQAGVGGPDPDRHLLTPLTAPRADRDGFSAEALGALLSGSIERLGLERARDSGLVEDLFALADLLQSGEARDELAARVRRAVGALGTPAAGPLAEWIPPRTKELGRGRTELNGEDLQRYVYRTGHGALGFLPLRGMGGGGSVSVATISRLLERVRKEYDVVLVDTGPIPGTVESSIVAAQADSVVMVVAPGDRRPDVERAVAHLESIGARLAGVVFNRATEKDVYRASRSVSMSRSEPGSA